MSTRTKVVLAVLWVLSLFAVGQWTTEAQTVQQPGFEVRFLQSKGQEGVLVANFGGQWLPVTPIKMPDMNGLLPR